MTFAPADLRGAFPEFANTTAFPDTQITFWTTQAYNSLSACRITSPGGSSANLDLAAMLFVAHNITLSARNALAASIGGVPGEASGPLASKSVDGSSRAYNTEAASVSGAGSYNLTSYGQRLRTMLKGFSTGPVYVPGRRPFGAYPARFPFV